MANRRETRSEGRAPSAPGVRIGRVLGVDLGVDWSLLIIFALICVNLGLGVLPYWHPAWNPALTWTVAVAAAVLFFVSVLLHELSHAVVANAQGIPVRRITLFIFGGMAHMEREPPSARSEFLMAVVGPITSIVIGLAALWAGAALAGDAFARYPNEPLEAVQHAGPVATLLLWLGPINVLLGVFNMVPGFPLDGGRVLRSILWAGTGSLEKATRWASNVGRGFAWFLIGSGVFMLFGGAVPLLGGGPIQGLWLVLIGWFLNNAAQATYQQQVVTAGLEGVSVRDIMLTRFETVAPDATVALLVRDHVMRSDQRAFPVVAPEGGRLAGLVCLADVRKVPETGWSRTHVADVMTPAGDLVAVDPDDPATEALQRLSRRGVNQVPVVEHGDIVGLVRRQDIVKWLSLHGGGSTRLAEAQLRR